MLVRDEFRGKRFVNALIDLPFALPTIVAGLTLLALYGPDSPLGIDVAYTRAAVLLALLFVTLPFVVRAVQPVLIELDREMEEAAASLGATPLHGLPPHRPAQPRARGPRRRGARVRPRARRVRLGGADLGQPAVQDRGGVGVHLRPASRSDDRHGAAAVSVVLLVIAFVVLLGIGGGRAKERCAMSARRKYAPALRSALGYLAAAARAPGRASSSTAPSRTASAPLWDAMTTPRCAARALAHAW